MEDTIRPRFKNQVRVQHLSRDAHFLVNAATSRMYWLPRLLVMMMIVLRKSTVQS